MLTEQDARLLQRDCAAGCVMVFAKSRRLHGRQYFKIRAVTAFKVIEVGTNQKPVCDFLSVINSN